MKHLYRRLRDRAIDRFADNDMWFAAAALCVVGVPVMAVLVY